LETDKAAIDAPTVNEDRLFVESVKKAFKVLEAFGPDHLDLGLTEIISLTGLNKSAAQRFTHTLIQLGYLKKNPSSRRYSLSQKVLESANNFLTVDTLVNRAAPHIIELRRQLDMRIGMGCLHEACAMYLIPLQSNKAAFRTAHPGFKIPVYCTSTGRALLAFLPEAEARALIESSDRKKHTPFTLIDIDDIMREIARVRENGYCINDCELIVSDINISAPIFDSKNNVIATVTASGPKSSWTMKDIETRVANSIMETARAISWAS